MSAGGNFVPPMVIFKRKRMTESLKDGAPPGSVVVNNESGWMTKEHFLEWLTHFVYQVGCTKDNPCLLILDGHVSHTKTFMHNANDKLHKLQKKLFESSRPVISLHILNQFLNNYTF